MSNETETKTVRVEPVAILLNVAETGTGAIQAEAAEKLLRLLDCVIAIATSARGKPAPDIAAAVRTLLKELDAEPSGHLPKPRSLEELSDLIRGELQSVVTRISMAGVYLLAAQAAVNPDEWESWWRRNCGDLADVLSQQLGADPFASAFRQLH